MRVPASDSQLPSELESCISSSAISEPTICWNNGNFVISSNKKSMMTDLHVICFHTLYQEMIHLLHSVCTAVSVGSTGGQQSSYHGVCLLSCIGPPSGGQTLWRLLCANLPCENMKKHQTNILTCRGCLFRWVSVELQFLHNKQQGGTWLKVLGRLSSPAASRCHSESPVQTKLTSVLHNNNIQLVQKVRLI